MPSHKAPILVTGAHRSGSTWVGKILSLHPQVEYIHEPFNKEGDRLPSAYRVPYWFAYLPDIPDADSCLRAYADMLAFKQPYLVREGISRRTAFKHHLQHTVHQYRRRLARHRPLVKDPLALFSANALADAFGMQVVCTIRHPLPFCASIKKWQWAFPFEDILAQTQLVTRYFDAYRSELEQFAAKEQPLLDQAILIWKLCHHVIAEYQNTHQDWAFVKHVVLLHHPEREFEALCSQLGLEWNASYRKAITESLSKGDNDPKDPLYQSRDRKTIMAQWQKSLSKEECHYILKSTEALVAKLYTEDERSYFTLG